MQAKPLKHPELVLIANDAYRIAMFRRAMRQAGLDCTLRRLSGTKRNLSYLAHKRPYEGSRLPDLVMFDFADVQARAIDLVRQLAFGGSRSKVPVILLTTVESEAILAGGEIDGGEATMFSPRPLASLLGKLADQRLPDFLDAIATLYQYGPILARQPRHFLNPLNDPSALSA